MCHSALAFAHAVRLHTMCAPGCPLTDAWGTTSHSERPSICAIDAPWRVLSGQAMGGASGDTCQPHLPPSFRSYVHLRTIRAPGYPLTAKWGPSSHFQRPSVGAIDAPCWPLSGSAIKKNWFEVFLSPFWGEGVNIMVRTPYPSILQTMDTTRCNHHPRTHSYQRPHLPHTSTR